MNCVHRTWLHLFAKKLLEKQEILFCWPQACMTSQKHNLTLNVIADRFAQSNFVRTHEYWPCNTNASNCSCIMVKNIIIYYLDHAWCGFAGNTLFEMWKTDRMAINIMCSCVKLLMCCTVYVLSVFFHRSKTIVLFIFIFTMNYCMYFPYYFMYFNCTVVFFTRFEAKAHIFALTLTRTGGLALEGGAE